MRKLPSPSMRMVVVASVNAVNTTSLPVPPTYEILALRPEFRKFDITAPSANPANVPTTASVPSLLMMMNVLPATGTNPEMALTFRSPFRFTVPTTFN